MALASTSAFVVWFLVLAGAGWALAAGALHRPRRRQEWHEDTYCHYCQWPVGRSSWFEPIHWQGHTFCSLACLRRDGDLAERERCLD